MYCPQCGTESSSGLLYCRLCGANLKVVGKAISLSDAIARIPGPLPGIVQGMMKNLKGEQVSEDVSRAMDEMKQELVRSPEYVKPLKPSWFERRQKTARQRREKHITSGTISLFSGAGLAIFLYFLSNALVLKLPPDFIAQVPFEIDPVVRIIWLIGMLPVFSGLGHILAGLLIRPDPPAQIETSEPVPELQDRDRFARPVPTSITEHTTNILDRKIQ